MSRARLSAAQGVVAVPPIRCCDVQRNSGVSSFGAVRHEVTASEGGRLRRGESGRGRGAGHRSRVRSFRAHCRRVGVRVRNPHTLGCRCRTRSQGACSAIKRMLHKLEVAGSGTSYLYQIPRTWYLVLIAGRSPAISPPLPACRGTARSPLDRRAAPGRYPCMRSDRSRGRSPCRRSGDSVWRSAPP